MKKNKRITQFTFILITLFLFSGCQSDKALEKHVIPYPDDYSAKEGAAAYDGVGDHVDSGYFKHPDFYNMKSTDTLTILSNFTTYQQSTEYHCGPATALMVIRHYGKTEDDELSIGEIMQTHKDLNGSNKEEAGVADEQGERGTSTDRMLSYFEHMGWNTQSSLTEGKLENGATFEDPTEFTEWVVNNLKENAPIMVEWLDWDGHWQAVIGYDTMGTDHFGDDVLVMADPYDTSDHFQDGYYIVNAERFFYMWMDKEILPESQSVQQWIIAKPQ